MDWLESDEAKAEVDEIISKDDDEYLLAEDLDDLFTYSVYDQHEPLHGVLDGFLSAAFQEVDWLQIVRKLKGTLR